MHATGSEAAADRQRGGMDSCEEPRRNVDDEGELTTDSSTSECQQQEQEEEDWCGELPLGGGTATTTTAAGGLVHHRRCSEFYPPGSAPRGVGGMMKQGRRDRRLSDPGRLEVPLLRVSLHGDPSNNGGDRCLQPGVRLSDPRLDVIRSLLESGPCEVGEALPAAGPPSSPPLYRAGQSLRSKSPAADAAAAKSRQARWDSRRLSLPTPAPLSSLAMFSRRASGGGPGGGGGSWLPGEMGEAMGAVSGTPPAAVDYPTGSPPPRPAPMSLCAVEQSATAAVSALRRRRSVSLDQSSRLEAISEENASLAAALKARKAEQQLQSD